MKIANQNEYDNAPLFARAAAAYGEWLGRAFLKTRGGR